MRRIAICAATGVSMLVTYGPALAADQLIRNVHVIDVRTGTALKAQDILLRDGLIVRIGNNPMQAPNSTVTEGGGGYVIPGLWDSNRSGS